MNKQSNARDFFTAGGMKLKHRWKFQPAYKTLGRLRFGVFKSQPTDGTWLYPEAMEIYLVSNGTSGRE